MKKSILLLLMLFLTSVFCEAQTQFQLAIGGTNSDYAYSIIQTAEGGYALAGWTESFGAGAYDFYIIKLNSGGILQWNKTVGGISNDYAYSIIQTTDGGYAVAGITNSFGAGGGDMYILKLNASGALQWSRTVGGTDYEEALCIIQTIDGGYAVTGETSGFGGGYSNFYIVKLNSSGTLQWNSTIGGIANDWSYSIIQTTDGGYAAAGITNSFGAGYYDMYIVKLDASGALQWSRTVGGTGLDRPYSIIQTTDGGYAVAGYTNSFGAGGGDMYIVKLGASGTLQWSRTVGGIIEESAYSILQTTDGGYAVAGWTNSFGTGINDMYIVKLNSSSTLQWSKTVGGTSLNRAYSIIQTTDGGYALAGYTGSFGMGYTDMYIVKFDANWNTCANTMSPPSQSGTGGITTSPNPTVTSPSPTVNSPSPTVSSGGTVTTICVIGIEPISNEIPGSFELEQNYPNPFNPKTIINFQLPIFSYVKLTVYDVLGREVTMLVNEELKPGKYSVDWDATNFPSGVYFYKLEAGDASTEFIPPQAGLSVTETKKIVLIK